MRRRDLLSLIGTGSVAASFANASLAQTVSKTVAVNAVSSTAFGVVPNLQADQSAQFQRMLDAASVDGQMVRLAAGTYRVNEIRCPEGMMLVGESGRTKLVQNGGQTLLYGRDLRRALVLDIDLAGGEFKDSSAKLGTVDFRNVGYVSLHDCSISGGSNDAVYLEQCSGDVSRNTVSGGARFGIFGVQSHALTITENEVTQCGNGGIILHRWEQGEDGSEISGNTVKQIRADNGGTGQWGNGINVFRTENVAVSANLVTDCAFSAVRANAARNFQVVNNTCLRSGETAIYAEFGFRNAFISQNTIDGATNGISVTNYEVGGQGAVVSQNTVRNLSLSGSYEPMEPGFGIGIFVEAETRVIGNMIENAPLFGINVGWGPHLKNVVVRSNTIVNAETGIGVSSADGAGNAVLEDNAIDARQAAIIAHHWARPVTGDLILGDEQPPHNIRVRGNRLI
ncbi:MAG: TIGR03808 family TAT-translocated repetitive protein [Pseudomonadota bacterium]